MKRLIFFLKGIVYSTLTLVISILIVLIYVWWVFIYKTIIPMLDGPIEGPMYRDHGLGPF